MRKLELENFGVQEMDAKEMQAIDGGGLWLAALGAALIISAIDNFGDIRAGFSDGVKGRSARY